jgi:hypothetical protein
MSALVQSSKRRRIYLLQNWSESDAIGALMGLEIQIRDSILACLTQRSRDLVLEKIKQNQNTEQEADQKSHQKQVGSQRRNRKAGLDLLPTEIFWEIALLLPCKMSKL